MIHYLPVGLHQGLRIKGRFSVQHLAKVGSHVPLNQAQWIQVNILSLSKNTKKDIIRPSILGFFFLTGTGSFCQLILRAHNYFFHPTYLPGCLIPILNCSNIHLKLPIYLNINLMPCILRICINIFFSPKLQQTMNTMAFPSSYIQTPRLHQSHSGPYRP